MITKIVNCSVCVFNNDFKVSIQLVWDNVLKKLFLEMCPLNVEITSPYGFNIEIAKGSRNGKKESELLLKYLEDNAAALIKAYNDNNQQGIVDVICGYKHKMRGLKQTTRTYYVMKRDGYGQACDYHCENLSPDMIGDKWVVDNLHTALFLTQD